MSTTQYHDADRETLSALFDGELDGAATRFAVKRLDHDRQWREACGRWQLAGDALRRRATGVAPPGFADRVGAALHDEDPHGASSIASSPRIDTPKRRNWIGGAALAASVAVAALFVARPFTQSDVSPLPAAPMAASTQPAAPASDAAETAIAQSSPPPATPAMREDAGLDEEPATTVAVADARRLDPAESATSPRGIQEQEPTTTAPVTVASIANVATSGLEPESPHPFLPPGEIVSRPWPRAVLSNYPTGNAFNVGFDSRTAGAGQAPSPGSSSFYPFEPRMMDAQPSTPPTQDRLAPDAPDWPRR